jgi:hypothetical protein
MSLKVSRIENNQAQIPHVERLLKKIMSGLSNGMQEEEKCVREKSIVV